MGRLYGLCWRNGPRRGLRATAIALVALLPTACLIQGPRGVNAATVLDRVREVEVGDTLEHAHSLLREDPVRKPNHPGDPFSSPHRVVELAAPDGSRVRLETYVVGARSAEGCPDFHYDDVPIVFVDGVVAGKTWEYVEWRWRDWGGELDLLRSFQDRYRCPAADGSG